MSKDINNKKDFHEWLQKTFGWVDNEAKRLMFRAWCARRKTLVKK